MPRPFPLPRIGLAALMLAAACTTPNKDTAMPDPGHGCTATLADGTPPALEPGMLGLLSRTERFTVPVPRTDFTAWFDTSPLAVKLPGGGGIAAVTGTRDIGQPVFPAAGSRRIVCLADGGTAIEDVLDYEQGRRLRYLVWGYTTAAAAPIAYGVGEFIFADAPGGTAVAWTYSFRLKTDRFPGMLGAVGRGLFRLAFFDTRYAEFMRTGVEAMTQAGVAAQRPGQAMRDLGAVPYVPGS